MKLSSTKKFGGFPCAHAQWFDTNKDGTPGACSAFHGYDRFVKLTFTGEPDKYGWVYPFGGLKEVRSWLEFYFDHTSILPANDPWLEQYKEKTYVDIIEENPRLATLRILPYGVSMEMSSLFIWEHVNPYIYSTSEGRVTLTKVECIEHDNNSAFLETSQEQNQHQAQTYTGSLLPKLKMWSYKVPTETLLDFACAKYRSDIQPKSIHVVLGE